jgi:hypothetical protein
MYFRNFNYVAPTAVITYYLSFLTYSEASLPLVKLNEHTVTPALHSKMKKILD